MIKDKKPEIRNKKGQWKKGQSGNPGGRPKTQKELAEKARKFSDKAIETLGFIMLDPTANASDRIRAISELLDRGYGKAAQQISLGDGDGNSIIPIPVLYDATVIDIDVDDDTEH